MSTPGDRAFWAALATFVAAVGVVTGLFQIGWWAALIAASVALVAFFDVLAHGERPSALRALLLLMVALALVLAVVGMKHTFFEAAGRVEVVRRPLTDDTPALSRVASVLDSDFAGIATIAEKASQEIYDGNCTVRESLPEADVSLLAAVERMDDPVRRGLASRALSAVRRFNETQKQLNFVDCSTMHDSASSVRAAVGAGLTALRRYLAVKAALRRPPS